MNNLTEDEVKKAVDTVIGKTQLFTPSLRDKIHTKAISQSQSKKKSFHLIPKILSVGIVAATLIFILTIIENKQESDIAVNETINENYDVSTDDLGLGIQLKGYTNRKELEKMVIDSLKFLEALSAGDFERIKNTVHSDVDVDLEAKSITFYKEGKLFYREQYTQKPSYEITDFELSSFFISSEGEPTLIIRTKGNVSYYFTFKEDERNNNAFMIHTVLTN